MFGSSSATKRDAIVAMGVNHPVDSRSTSFAAEILSLTNGAGVDVVLNSLSGGDFIEKTLSATKKEGTFVEIGKKDIWTAEQMAAHRGDVLYEVFDLLEVTRTEPGMVKAMFKDIASKMESGELTALPVQTFPLGSFLPNRLP